MHAIHVHSILFDAQLLDLAVERAFGHEQFGGGLAAAPVIAAQGADDLLALHVGLSHLAQLLGLFALLTMLVCAAERMLGAVRRKNGMGSTGGVFCLLAFGGSFLAYRLPIWSWAVGAAIFWGVVPILTQVIVNIKKSEK